LPAASRRHADGERASPAGLGRVIDAPAGRKPSGGWFDRKQYEFPCTFRQQETKPEPRIVFQRFLFQATFQEPLNLVPSAGLFPHPCPPLFSCELLGLRRSHVSTFPLRTFFP
jgi:hypothetical protein